MEPADTSFPNGNVFSPKGKPAGSNLASGGFAGDAVLAPEDKPARGQEKVPLLARLDGWTPVASGSGRIGIPGIFLK